MTEGVFHVACSADERYAGHCAAMLHSVLSNNPGVKTCVHFLRGPQVSDLVTDRLARLLQKFQAHLNIITVTADVDKELVALGDIPGAQWYRVLLADRLPDIEKVLYLDSDLLALETLQPLWSISLEGRLLAAVTNPFPREIAEYPTSVLRLAHPHRYFNTGVMLMNLKLMRQSAWLQQVKEAAANNLGRFRWPEQDAVNLVSSESRLELDPRWNLLGTILGGIVAGEIFVKSVLEAARQRPAVVHFEGPHYIKPWHYMCTHVYRPLYYKHLSSTPWPVPPPEGRTLINMVKVNAPRLLAGPVTKLRRLPGRVKRRLLRLLSPAR